MWPIDERITELVFGWLSILPPVTAIVLAITTRRVVVSLLSGVLIGAFIQTLRIPPANTIEFLSLPVTWLDTYLWQPLADPDHLRVFAFTMLMGAMVNVIQRSGGMHGVIDRLAPLARTRRGGQLLTWLLGLIVFFDDYANTLLLGGTMRPLADRLRISREKLAYLVDSTAAPVSGLAIISTWVAGEIGFINAGFDELDLPERVNGFDIFIETIPYRFYVLFALIFVPLMALLGRDFGPMLRAERDALGDSNGQTDNSTVRKKKRVTTKIEIPRRWFNAAIPILTMIGVTVALLLSTGQKAVADDEHLEATWFQIFSQGDSYLALVYGSLAGLFAAIALPRLQNIVPLDQLGRAAFDGARHVLVALVILWLAWSLSDITSEKHLGTGKFLGGMLEQNVPVVLMPTLVFVLSSFVSFATGTSWGTMGILMPLVVRVTYQMLDVDGSVEVESTLMIATIGSVLAGSIFGDHCSPISDTTVLSSQASGCNHVAHVWTQLPYAVLVGVVSIICGTLPVSFGMSVWIALPLGVAVLVAALLLIGKPVERISSRK